MIPTTGALTRLDGMTGGVSTVRALSGSVIQMDGMKGSIISLKNYAPPVVVNCWETEAGGTWELESGAGCWELEGQAARSASLIAPVTVIASSRVPNPVRRRPGA